MTVKMFHCKSFCLFPFRPTVGRCPVLLCVRVAFNFPPAVPLIPGQLFSRSSLSHLSLSRTGISVSFRRESPTPPLPCCCCFYLPIAGVYQKSQSSSADEKMPRGAATKKGKGGQANKAGQPSVLAFPAESGIPDQPARRQQRARRGKGRSTSSVSDQETSSVTESSCQLSRHERMEKGLTRLGKKANDRPEAVTWGESEKGIEQGDNTTITALLPTSSGSPRSTPTAQVRLSDLLGSDSNGDSPATQYDGGLTPADSLSTSALPCRTSPAPASLRSSFQTAQGTPTPTSTGSRRSRRSRGEKAHEEEEEKGYQS